VAFSYTVGTCNLLPISLKNFTGYKNAEKNVLKWITATETNNQYFDIERSIDGISFEKIATVKGNGNTTSETSYSYVDNLSEQKIFYYRLKQVDNNGNVTLSNIVILYAKQNNLDVMIYPNPAKNKINIQYPENIKNHQIRLFNMFGQVMLETVANTVDVSNLPLGVYIVNIETERGTINQKIIKQ
jgi:ribosomal protein L2